MRAALFTLKLLLITFVAATAICITALPPLKWSGLTSEAIEVSYVRERFPIRLLEPEWVSSPAGLFEWAMAESKLRLGLIAAAWFAAGSVLVWRFVKARRSRLQQIARLHGQRLNQLREGIEATLGEEPP